MIIIFKSSIYSFHTIMIVFFQYINWNLDPEIIKLFNFIPIRYYSIFFSFGLFLGFLVIKGIFKKEHIPNQILDGLAIYVVVGTVIGARLGHCLFYEPEYYFNHILEIFLPVKFYSNGGWGYTGFQGLASHGGAIGVLIAIYIYSRKFKIDLLWILDRIAIAVPLTGAFIRFGNFMNSEIIGKPTKIIFGVVFERIDTIPRHPAQLYEAFSYLIIFFILREIYKNNLKNKNGYLFGIFLILLFTTRFCIEFIKINQVNFESYIFLNMGQILSVPFVLIGIILAYKNHVPHETI